MEQKIEWWLPGVAGREEWGAVFNGHRVAVWGDERVPGVGGGDGSMMM